MLNIPEEVKELYKQDGIYKNIRIVFPNGEHEDICNDNIEQNSVQFTESLCSQDEFTLGITESPTFQADIHCAQDVTGCVIDVFNEIDCTSLGSEFCARYCEYKNDLGIYVYSIQYGQFTITSAKLSHANDKRSIDAYGNGINYTMVYSDMIKFMNNYPASSGYGNGYYYSTITSFENRKISGLYTGQGDSVDLQEKYYDYQLGNNKTLRVHYKYYDGEQLVHDITYSSGLRVIEYDGLSIIDRVAVIDFDKISRTIDLNIFIDSIKASLSHYELENFNQLLSENFIKSLYNPRYTYAFYKAEYVHFTQGSWQTTFCVSWDEMFLYNEFLNCDNYEFFMSEKWMSGLNETVCSHLNYPSLENVLNEDNIPCSMGRLYIPVQIEYINNNSTSSIEYEYKNLDVRNNVSSIFMKIAGGTSQWEPSVAWNGKKVSKTRVYKEVNGSRTYTRQEDNYRVMNDIFDAIKYVYESLGASMIVSRYGDVKMVYIKDMFSSLFPSETLYPSEELYPDESDTVVTPSLYIECEYGENIEKPYGRIYLSDSTYRDIHEDYSLYPNKYKVYDLSGNAFITGGRYVNETIQMIFDNVQAALENAIYMPCDIEMKALPYLEVGDTLQVVTATGGFQTIINRRTIKGEQHLTDNIEVN